MSTITVPAVNDPAKSTEYEAYDEMPKLLRSLLDNSGGGGELKAWAVRISNVLDALMRLTMPVITGACPVCGDWHVIATDEGDVDPQAHHTLIVLLDTGRRTEADLAWALFEVLQAIRPEYEDARVESIIQCGRARLDAFSTIEVTEECEAFTDDELMEGISDFLTYGLDSELPITHTVIWDGDMGTVTVWEF